MADLLHGALTHRIIGVFYDVYNALGYGFLEKVYENALVVRLRAAGMSVSQQERILVYFDGQVVGEYFADLVVEDKIIVELKAAETVEDAHTAQLLNYLRATQYEVGLLLNFGPKPTHMRRAYRNAGKPSLQSVHGPR